MSAAQFEAAARLLASGLPRRQVIRLLARSMLGGGVFIVTGSEAGAQPGCRREGHPCEGNQTCCPGLTCAESEQGSARRCTAGRTPACEDGCPTTEPGVVVVGADVDIDAECVYSGEMRRTSCTFTATAGDRSVASVVVPKSILCTEVVGGAFEEVVLAADAAPSDSDTGLKSTRTEDGAAIVTVELDGEVTTAATATYWCETDGGEPVPVTGPGLRCGDSAAAPVTDASASTGTVVVHVYHCDAASAGMEISWFDVCQVSTNLAMFQLAPVNDDGQVEAETQPVDADGVVRFGRLPPGTYRLEQMDGDWCHAESDSVDDQGNVIVSAAEVVTVWVFTCGGGS